MQTRFAIAQMSLSVPSHNRKYADLERSHNEMTHIIISNDVLDLTSRSRTPLLVFLRFVTIPSLEKRFLRLNLLNYAYDLGNSWIRSLRCIPGDETSEV
jgi:hypothetical protein